MATPKLPPHRTTHPGRKRKELPADYRTAGDGTIMLRLHVYLPKEVVEWLEIECERRNINRSAMIQKCIQSAIFR